jgi:hypothetical protein
MDSDPQLALEFLQQMQTALDDVAPSGFNPAQWKEIDNRISTLTAPLAKAGFGLGFIGKLFGWLFKKKPAAAEAPARIKKKGAKEEKPSRKSEAPVSLVSQDAVVAPASAVATEGMEDEAPIAPAAPAAEPAPEAAPEIVAATHGSPSPEAPSKSNLGPLLRKLGAALGALLLLAGLGYGGFLGYGRFQSWRASRKAPPPPPPAPRPTPQPKGPPQRAQPPALQDEPLPSELPPQTPQAAGQASRQDGMKIFDEEGRQSLPLP